MTDEPKLTAASLEEILEAKDAGKLDEFLGALSPADRARAISHLGRNQHEALMTMLSPEDAAGLLEELADEQARDLLESVQPVAAGVIADEIHSDIRADILGGMDLKSTDEILRHMDPDEAEDVRELIAYKPDTAGGLMITEYLAYTDDKTVGEIIQDMQDHGEEYADYDVQYAYITDTGGRLKGVLRMRDLLFTAKGRPAAEVMIANAVHVRDNQPLEQLTQFFGEHRFFGVPALDSSGRLVGVLRRSAVEEASAERANSIFLRVSGIIGGEELRNMPLAKRFSRRLSFLSLNIVLNVVAASVIAMNMDVLDQVIALAVFMPIISDMSGCSGNQAVAVSIRELALGLAKPRDFLRVFRKELAVGLINGFALALLLGFVAFLWKGNPWLGVVAGTALGLNTVIAVCFGGLVPLMLKGLKLDPALVSGPMLTTVTDMCGFFLVLTFAGFALDKLV